MVMALTGRVSPVCSAGDEGPAALAIVQASPVDCGVYRCTIHNEHGSASTDFCLSPEGECAPGSRPGQAPRGGQLSSVHRWCSLWADQPEGSCFLFFVSTQCWQASSPEKKVKVWSLSGEAWVALISAQPSVGDLLQGLGIWSKCHLTPQTAALCLLVQEMLGEEEGEGLFQEMVGEEVAKGGGVNSSLCPLPCQSP